MRKTGRIRPLRELEYIGGGISGSRNALTTLGLTWIKESVQINPKNDIDMVVVSHFSRTSNFLTIIFLFRCRKKNSPSPRL